MPANTFTHTDTSMHLVHFCCEDDSYLGECYWNDLPKMGMYGWLKENMGYAGKYLCKIYDLNTNNKPREVMVTLS